MEQWGVVVGIAITSFALRYLPLRLLATRGLRPSIQNTLKMTPPIILMALAAPVIVAPGDHTVVMLGLENPRMIGALCAVIVGLWARNFLLTIAVSTAAFFAWRWYLAVG